MGNGHSQHQTLSACRRLTNQNRQKGLAGKKGQRLGGSKGTSTSKDYLFTFVRVNFSDFHHNGRNRFPQSSTTARNKHGRKLHVLCARNKMIANILPQAPTQPSDPRPVWADQSNGPTWWSPHSTPAGSRRKRANAARFPIALPARVFPLNTYKSSE